MAVADWDLDGLNDLAVIDRLGFGILGDNPSYFPFPIAAIGDSQLLVKDLDGDGQVELITQREFERSSPFRTVRVLTVWRRSGSGLERLWEVELPGGSYVLLHEDVDNDGEGELLSASDAIQVFHQIPGRLEWEVGTEIPFVGQYPYGSFALIDVVRVADVDADGLNEILATGNSGRLTIYKHFERYGISRYPVLWQSSMLVGEELTARTPDSPPRSLSQGLGVWDVDCDGGAEALVGTMEFGVHPDGLRGIGRILLFEYRQDGSFETTWTSPWTGSAGIPALYPLDLNGDGCAEFIHNGEHIYSRSESSDGFEVIRSFANRSGEVAIGNLGDLRFPTDAVRIVPVGWSMPRLLDPNTEVEGTVSFKSVWASAEDVSVRLVSDHPAVTVLEAGGGLGNIASGQWKDSGVFRIRVNEPGGEPGWVPDEGATTWVYLRLEVSAASGYRQTIPLGVGIRTG
jgi:hypothetical protein